MNIRDHCFPLGSLPFSEVATDHHILTSANEVTLNPIYSVGGKLGVDKRKGSQHVYRGCTFIYYCPYPLK